MSRRRSYKVLLNICVFIIAAFLCLAACEYAVRLLHLSKTYNSYDAVNMAAYSPKKNSSGWRDKEFTKNKKLNTFRIICIGDSVTEGYKVDIEKTYAKVLEDRLLGLNCAAEVINAGACGNNTSANLATIKTAMQFQPDLIIYQFGLNDIEGLEHMEHVSIGSSKGQQGPTRQQDNLKVMLRKSALYLALAERYNYLRLKLGYKHWSFNEWYIEDSLWEKEFVKLSNGLAEAEINAKILIIYMPYDFQIYSSREEILVPSKKLSKFCQDNSYNFINFTQIFKTQRNRYNIFLDDCHLSEFGNKIVANYLADFIRNHELLPKK